MMMVPVYELLPFLCHIKVCERPFSVNRHLCQVQTLENRDPTAHLP